MTSQQPPQEPASQAEATQNPQQAEEATGYAPLVDPRLPTRKDTSLREFLSKIDDYAPIVCISDSFLILATALVMKSGSTHNKSRRGNWSD